jgi:hypothetical protein
MKLQKLDLLIVDQDSLHCVRISFPFAGVKFPSPVSSE